MKTWLKIILALIAFVVLVLGGIIYYGMKAFKMLDQVELVSEKVNEIIPFYYSQTAHMLVDISINDSKEKYPFILDSGASSYVFQNLLDKHELSDIGNGLAMGTGGSFYFPDIYQIDKLKLGDIEFKNVAAESIEKIPFSCVDDVYGILGKEAMQHLIWQIDFNKKQIQVVSAKNQLNFKENAETIYLEENEFGHQLYVETVLGNDPVTKRFTVDLGNSGYASISSDEIEHQTGRKIEMIGNAGAGLDGEDKSETFLQEINDFQIDNLVVPQFSISASGTPMNLLGLGFLENYRTTISWKDQELILEPYEQQNFGRKGFTFSARYDTDADALLIKAIYKNMAADKLGIRPEAKIISLNGALMDTEDKFCEFDFSVIDQLTLVYEQEGSQKNATLDKVDYFPVAID